MAGSLEKLKKAFEEGLVDTLVRLQSRGADRDNTILLALPYNSFGEWLSENPLFLTGGALHQSMDRYLINLLRHYIMAQIKGVFPNAPEERMSELYVLVKDIVSQNIERYTDLVQHQHALAWRSIKKSFEPTFTQAK